MMNRRGFVLSLTTGLVALVLVVGSVLAEELVGTIIKVDADAKLIVVVPKDSDKEIKVKVTDKTEQVTKKGTEKLAIATKVTKKMAWRDGNPVNFPAKEYMGSDRWVETSAKGYTLFTEGGQKPAYGIGIAPDEMDEISTLLKQGVPVTIK